MISYPHLHRHCLFLDRDGVINVDTGYPYRKDELQLIGGVGKAIAKMNSLGYLVIVVTNQSGIARGFFFRARCASISSSYQYFIT